MLNFRYLSNVGTAAAAVKAGGNGGSLTSYTLSADQAGLSSTDTTILFDTLDTSGFYEDLGLSVASGVVSIPPSAQEGFSFFRSSVYLHTSGGSASYTQVYLRTMWDSSAVAYNTNGVLTRNSFDGTDWRVTANSGWIPFGLTTTPTIQVTERSSAGAHSAFSAPANAPKTRLTVEFI